MLTAVWEPGRRSPGACPGTGLAPVRVHAVTPGLLDPPRRHITAWSEGATIVNHRAAMWPERRVGTAGEVAPVSRRRLTHDDVLGPVVQVDGSGRFGSHGLRDAIDDCGAAAMPLTARDADPAHVSAQVRFHGSGPQGQTRDSTGSRLAGG
jgi:hypothetical protein